MEIKLWNCKKKVLKMEKCLCKTGSINIVWQTQNMYRKNSNELYIDN